MNKIKVLVVDDSAIVRKILSEAIAGEPDLEIVGTAPDPFVARDKILSLKPDVLTLDIEMPRMDGLTFLKKLMHHHPMPVVVISSLGQASCQATLEALQLGAVEVLAKPGGPYSVGELRTNLAAKIRAAAMVKVARRNSDPASPPPAQPAASQPASHHPAMTHQPAVTHHPAVTAQPAATKPDEPTAVPAALRRTYGEAVIAIGASTGGIEALQAVLTRLPANMPGIVITQHIPAGFSRAFADRMNKICPMQVREAADGDAVVPGLALIAPGNFHMVLRKTGAGYRVNVKDGPQVCYQRPSVDVLFSSVAEAAGSRAVGVLLTGMGYDGAQGMLRIKKAGAPTIAQDEASCLIFGMPREAIRIGAADQIVSLTQIPAAIVAQLARLDRREPLGSTGS